MTVSLIRVAFLGLTATSLAAELSVLSTLDSHVSKGHDYAIRNTCENINYRKSWNVFTFQEKHDYIKAEICLMHHPPHTGLVENATNVWDEFSNAHISQGNNIHHVGQFLPWHRYYVRTHELALQTLCHYKGAQPYWDELTDLTNGDVSQSSVFDPITGFGGNSTGSKSCVADGPFQNITLHMTAAKNVEECFGYGMYKDAWQCYNAYPHLAGHCAVGGLMDDPIDSCNGPLFFLHHAYLDKLWWEWQLADYPARLFDMSGNNIAPDSTLDFFHLPRPGSEIVDYSGDNGTTTTLHHNLWMNSLVANTTVGEIMQLNASVICAEYVIAEDAVLYDTSVHTGGPYTPEPSNK